VADSTTLTDHPRRLSDSTSHYEDECERAAGRTTQIVATLREVGFDGWVTLELDAYEGEPSEEARMGRDAVRPLL
jgi:sugar phosphate isomerase/epimerase